MGSNLLLLAHRIPWPPDKGDKIRSFHLLRHLARRHRVHLAAFVDAAQDWQYATALRDLCVEVKLFARPRLRTPLLAAGAFWRGQSLTEALYRDNALRRWAKNLHQRGGIDAVLVYSSAMAQYAQDFGDVTRVIDFVDVDSEKWREYAQSKSWPLRALYQREARLLLKHERAVASAFDQSLFVSAAEAGLFRALAPESHQRVDFWRNGVNADYFSPQAQPVLDAASPYAEQEQAIVFTGLMSYWPNVDAVCWFAESVFPGVRQRFANASFNIVGADPAAQVRALARLPGVRVSGRVADVRPWLAHAALAVAPLRIARGIQNKVLEAMAMAKPVVLSAEALQGIDAQDGYELLLARDAPAMQEAVCRVLEGRAAGVGAAARRFVLSQFDWEASLARLDQASCAMTVRRPGVERASRSGAAAPPRGSLRKSI